jgi:hypothetical protein
MDILGVLITCAVAMSVLYSVASNGIGTPSSDVNMQDIVHGAIDSGSSESISGNGGDEVDD